MDIGHDNADVHFAALMWAFCGRGRVMAAFFGFCATGSDEGRFVPG